MGCCVKIHPVIPRWEDTSSFITTVDPPSALCPKTSHSSRYSNCSSVYVWPCYKNVISPSVLVASLLCPFTSTSCLLIIPSLLLHFPRVFFSHSALLCIILSALINFPAFQMTPHYSLISDFNRLHQLSWSNTKNVNDAAKEFYSKMNTF